MGIAFWIRRAVTVFAFVAAFLFAVDLLKGQGAAEAARFSAVWALLSTSVFIGARVYQSRRGQACAICQDTLVVPVEAE